MRRKRIKTPEEIVNRAIQKISGKGSNWESATIQGFQTNWRDWFTYIYPTLVSTVERLPERVDDIRSNILNRSLPVAIAISRASRQYRTLKMYEEIRRVTPTAPRVTAPAVTA